MARIPCGKETQNHAVSWPVALISPPIIISNFKIKIVSNNAFISLKGNKTFYYELKFIIIFQ